MNLNSLEPYSWLILACKWLLTVGGGQQRKEVSGDGFRKVRGWSMGGWVFFYIKKCLEITKNK